MMRAAVIAGTLCAPELAVAQGFNPSEAQAFADQIAPCWNIGALSEVAQTRSVTVLFKLDRRARPVPGSFQLVGAGKGTQRTTKEAYAAARRAVLRCGFQGFKLPLENYEQWKDIEMTFNPERTQGQ